MTRHKRNRFQFSLSSDGGFTLLETVLSVAVLGLGALILTSMGSKIAKQYTKAKQMTTAAMIAKSWLDEKKRIPYTDAFFTSSASGTITSSSSTWPSNLSDAAGFGLSWQFNENTPSSGERKISVNVFWDEGQETLNVKSLMINS